MKVIALVGQKGGISKSTTAAHLCRWLMGQGNTVALLDCDAQQSSSIWMSAIASPPTIEVLATTDEILDRVPVVSSGHDFTVIDGPAGLSELTRTILLRADLALVPCKPTGVDVRSAADTVRLIEQAQSVRAGAPKAALFLAMAIKGTNLKSESLEVLSGLGVPVLDAVIHQRQAIADSFGQTSTVFDLPGRAAADSAREFEKLFEEAIAL